jgi:aminopeptidase YwaD
MEEVALQETLQLTQRILAHLDYLVNVLGPRPVGSPQNLLAYNYLTEVIADLGFQTQVHTTVKYLRNPVHFHCTLQKSTTTEALSILPGFATLDADLTNLQVTPFIYKTQEDFREHPPLPGSLAIVELGKMHEADACQIAKPAAAVVWYREKNQSLYSGNCMRNQEEPALPGFALAYNDVQRILEADTRLDLVIKTASQPVELHNLVVDVGHVSHHPCFITHYDSRPFSPGANDNASGVACLLGILSLWSQQKPARFIFFDGEEVGTLGSRAYVEQLLVQQQLNAISCVVNPDSVGLGELFLYTADRYGPLSEKLLDRARQILQAHHWNVPERAARSGISDYVHFRRAGIPCLFLSDFPNDIRHTTGDTLENIDIHVLVQLTQILADDDFYCLLAVRK